MYIYIVLISIFQNQVPWRKAQFTLMSIQANFASLSEFHGKRHYMEFYLKIKKSSNEDQAQVLPMAKEVHKVCQELETSEEILNILHLGPSCSWPVLLTLVA